MYNYTKPFVSICCTTYNHEKYIKDAIESFLMQIFSFPIEILICDDASTDRTPEILRRYKEKYPHLIKPIFLAENHFSKGLKPSNYNYNRAQGEYIAFCEGDDFWTCPYKLQKQIDFLSNNKHIIICGHAVNQVDELGNVLQKSKYNIYKNTFLSQNELVKGDIIFPTLSIVFRNNVKIPTFYEVLNGDLLLFAYLSNFGCGYIFKDIMGTHRFSKSGIWSSLNTYERIDSLIFSQSKIPNFICLKRRSIAHYRFLRYSLLKDYKKARKYKNIFFSLIKLVFFLRPNSLNYLIKNLYFKN